MDDGPKLRAYIDKAGLNKTRLAADLGMTPQNLYQLFKSKTFTSETIKNVEKALKAKWKDIDSINIDVASRQQSGQASIVQEQETHYGDLKDRYIALLEKQVRDQESMLAKQESMLDKQDSMLIKITVIEKALSEAKRDQQVMYAFQNAFRDVALTELSKLTHRKNIMREFGEKTISYLEKYQKEGIEVHG